MFSSGALGTITTFDHLTSEWDIYKSRLTQWFIANDVNDASDKAKLKRKAILLSSLSESSYKLASDLALPQKIEDVEYDSIIKLLDSHFTPKRLGFAERYSFYAATQHLGESHTHWAARIRGLAAHCGFKNLEDALLDKFVMGMVAGPEREKLFAKDLQALTLAKAVELAENVRAARKAATATCSGSGDVAGASDAGHAAPDAVFSISKSEKCSVCGYTNHKSNQCRFKSYKCKKCNRKGHLVRMCAANSKVNYVLKDVADVGDDGELHSLQSKNKGGIIRPKFKVDDVVWVKQFCGNDKFRWVQGTIKQEIGNVMYSVYVPELRCTVVRHINQIRRFQAGDDSKMHCDGNQWHGDIESDDSSPSPQSRSANADALAGANADTVQPVEDDQRGEEESTSVEPSTSPSPSLSTPELPAPHCSEGDNARNIWTDSQNCRSKRRVIPVNYKPFF